MRRLLASTLGRIGDARGRGALAALLIDRDATVRRASAFSLGQLGEEGDVEIASLLLRSVGDSDRETGVLAVEALARIGVVLEDVVARLLEGPVEELFPRLLPSLFRFEGAGVVGWAVQGLELEDPMLRSQAAHALAREPQEGGLEALRTLTGDADPWIAGWAGRALGRIGDRSDLGRLEGLSNRPEPGPVIQALRAARRLFVDGRAAPPATWRPRILTLLDDPRPGVRVTAIEAAASWLLDDTLGNRLTEIAESEAGEPRRLAVMALTEANDPRAPRLVEALAGEREAVDRARSAAASGLLGAVDLLNVLGEDADPTVRAAALAVWLGLEPADVETRVRQALEDTDAGVRATALEWLVNRPILEASELRAALQRQPRDRIADARVAAIRALGARAAAVAPEQASIIETLAETAVGGDDGMRRAAIDMLGSLDQNQPPLGPAGGSIKPVAAYRDMVLQTLEPRHVDLETTAGTARLRLECPRAPLTCLSFMQLANQGFYDDLPFHRVVPDFVVQAGDPRGDGRGGPGYRLRDENTRLRYDRGVVGLALSGPDTGGSQFFVTLSPQPHLDGAYPAFGVVVSGLEVLDKIVQGDRIVRVRELGVE